MVLSSCCMHTVTRLDQDDRGLRVGLQWNAGIQVCLELPQCRSTLHISHLLFFFIESFPQMCLRESGCTIGYEPTKMSRDHFWRSISRDDRFIDLFYNRIEISCILDTNFNSYFLSAYDPWGFIAL